MSIVQVTCQTAKKNQENNLRTFLLFEVWTWKKVISYYIFPNFAAIKRSWVMELQAGY